MPEENKLSGKQIERLLCSNLSYMDIVQEAKKRGYETSVEELIRYKMDLGRKDIKQEEGER